MKTNRTSIRILAAAAFAWLGCGLASAQYTLTASAVTCGGGRCEGGEFVLQASAGQPAAGDMTGGDYVLRGGFVPPPPPPPPQGLRGDVDCDGAVTNFDVDPFLLAVSDPPTYALWYPDCDILNADTNLDGRADNFDVDSFVDCINAGGCP